MKPLKGITILDISRLLPGGFASLLLRQLGARVIKIEQPGLGDYYRAVPGTPKLLGDQVDVINEGKESLAVDLKTSEGMHLFKKLVKKADIVLESFRPGVLKKLGCDYAVLKKINPKIILCSLTGFGQTDKRKNLAGHDLNYLGLSGLLARNHDSHGEMMIPDFQVVDLAAGYDAAMRINAALWERSRTKRGCWIDASMSQAGHQMARLYQSRSPKLETKPSAVAGGLVRYGIYETSDKKYVTLGALEPKFWSQFCQLIGRPQWAFQAASYEPLGENIRKELKKIFQGKTQKEWTQLGEKYDLCLFPVVEWIDQGPIKKFCRIGAHNAKIAKELK